MSGVGRLIGQLDARPGGRLIPPRRPDDGQVSTETLQVDSARLEGTSQAQYFYLRRFFRFILKDLN